MKELDWIVKPQVIAFSVTVELLTYDTSLILASWPIDKWESLFISYRDGTDDPELKVAYDVCRATLKWAATCGASEVKLSKSKRDATKVYFTFTFERLESVFEFEKGLVDNVSGVVQ